MKYSTPILSVLCLLSSTPGFCAPVPANGDWPQLAHGPDRSGHAPNGVAPPYRARWIWCGPSLTLRNRAANPAWSDDLGLRTQPGPDYPLPDKVSFTIAGRAQPVVAGGRVFISDMDGRIHALSLDDGRTLLTADNPRGTAAALGVSGNVVIATLIPGAVAGFDAATGRRLWRVETAKAITGAPLLIGGRVYTGCHDGRIYALDALSGKVLWTSQDLGAPIVSDLCGDTSAIYVGAENMFFHKLELANGN